ncbi:hypothetical protein J2W99_003024 [Bosea robiniae]|uniref:hypothetical protein n=2 Tax=Boseaceae TaxID=2831100 RepID=UPI002857BD4D|nr:MULTISPECIES: hypothetical protein [unclassified Bosea (in: a-proteobacteria)]MDR6829285.1 hypothetical protein [Bosea robiniae]MDR7139566.1 hypothetical protein [Bosea sp. BE168]
MRLRSEELMDRLRSLSQQLRQGLSVAGAGCRVIWARVAAIDLVPALITCVDRIESGFRTVSHILRRLMPRRGLGLPGALAWRIAAALGGISLTAALVTALSGNGEGQSQLASLASPVAAATTQNAAVNRKPLLATTEADWVAITRPITIFNLEAPELGREAPAIEARRSRDGGRREDLLSFGTFAGAAPHLLLRLQTGDGIAAHSGSFTVALVHAAALRSLAVERGSTPATIETRFGPLETADIVLGDGSETRACLAFRSVGPDAPFAMSGWWCAGAKPSDRKQLTCLIDRLDLANAGAEPELRAAFARSELKRQPGCATPRLAATGRKVSWLDADGTMPALRMKTATAEPAAESRPRRAKKPRRER